MIDIYIGGSSKEMDAMDSIFDRVESLRSPNGIIRFRVSMRWTDRIREEWKIVGAESDENVSDYVNRESSILCRDAILRSSYCWFVTFENRYSRGTFAEMGIAYGAGIPFIVTGPQYKSCVFSSQASCRWIDTEKGFGWLQRRLDGAQDLFCEVEKMWSDGVGIIAALKRQIAQIERDRLPSVDEIQNQ
jgi:hypothetical protein